jgi:hypothetical protein
MAAIMALTGGMAIFYAITGQGKVYENDYPKAMKEEANQYLRKFLWIIGPIALASGVLEFIGYDWGFWIGFIILPAIVVYYIIFRRRFKQYLKKK